MIMSVLLVALLVALSQAMPQYGGFGGPGYGGKITKYFSTIHFNYSLVLIFNCLLGGYGGYGGPGYGGGYGGICNIFNFEPNNN